MVVTARSRSHLLINFIAFEIAWFSVVLGAAHHLMGAGVAVAVLVALLHLTMSANPLRELQLLVCVVLLGTAWDSTLVMSNVINYPTGQFLPMLAPIWIVAVWALFATTLNVSLVFLRGRPWLAALFGAIGAPLSFLGGMRLHALQFADTQLAMIVLAIGWAAMMPLLIYLSMRFDGVTASNVPRAAVAGVSP